MNQPIVFGAAYSVYVRAVRLVLEENHIPALRAATQPFLEE